MKSLLCLLSILIVVGACTETEPNVILQGSGEGREGTPGGGKDLNASGEGREGGHFLICDSTAPIPGPLYFNNVVVNETGEEGGYETGETFFIDYLVMIDSREKYDALRHFKKAPCSHNGTLCVEDSIDTPFNRLIDIMIRLDELYADSKNMEETLQEIERFYYGYVMENGYARWIKTENSGPKELPLTHDLAPQDLDSDKLNIVKKYCGESFFQAAVHDYTNPEDPVFHYSKYFRNNADFMQRSFRNVHEMLRFVLRNETEQIQRLTAYMHTKDFFMGEKEFVVKKIKIISGLPLVKEPFHKE